MSERDPLGVCGETLAQKYEIRELVASGGFSLVYKGHHKLWKSAIAVKFFTFLAQAPAEDRAALQQAFVNEGALLSDLSSQSASIVQPRDVGTFTTPEGEWIPYMVMEWLDGEPLDAILDRENGRGDPRRTPAEVFLMLEGVARALELAHQRGVAHRDVKPENLVVVGDPREPDVVKLLDFGVAQIMDAQAPVLGTTGRQVSSFTPSYGAPEQFDSRFGKTGPWTDVYQLALVAAELISGRQPLSGPNPADFAASSTDSRTRPTPAALGAFVSPDVEAVFEQALALYTTDRYISAGKFWSALADALGIIQTPSVRPPPISDSAVRAMTPPNTASGNTARWDADLDSLPTASIQPLPRPSHVPAVSATSGAVASGAGSVGTEPLPRSQVPTVRKDGREVPAGPSSPPLSRSLPSKAERPGSRWFTTAMIAGCAALLAGGGVFFLTAAGKDSASQVRATEATAQQPAAAMPAPKAACPEGMLNIPAGQYFMGSDADDALDLEKPSHHVVLDGYCLDETEVTVHAYQKCSDAGKCRRASKEVEWDGMTKPQARIYSTACNEGIEGRGDHPINCVSWQQAHDYCELAGKRLPTEAEWEYAARSSDGRVYPWGDEEPSSKMLNACGWECVNWANRQGEKLTSLYEENDRFPTTAPVGSFPAGNSRFGAKDIVGNVWEWVADWEGPYTKDEKHNPTGAAKGEKRVIRGGAWNGGYKAWLRPSFRYAMTPDTLSHGIGFRCAADLTK
ncbi:MAG: SUMF1/EgtB/PvdO family nonheme iron enzyme [Polyangiaceae bacterium]|nr:SUMF1/EgtB/PvdO family nonheme iron enzyme [Polyangiaceae bacterium]